MASTPQLLKAGGAAVTLTALLLMIAAIFGAHTYRNLAIGEDPSDPRHELIEKLAADVAQHNDVKADLDALDKLNREPPAGPANRALAETISAGLLVGLTLLSLQILLTRRTRRVINPGLFLATIAAWIFTVFTVHAFNRSDLDLHASNIAQAQTDVGNFDEIAPAVALGIITFTWLGLRPRIKEYS
jgi:hypothetical protein